MVIDVLNWILLVSQKKSMALEPSHASRDVYQLSPSRFGIPEKDQRYQLTGILHVGKTNDPSISKDSASIETILAHLKQTYTGRLGFEFAHIPVGYDSLLNLHLVCK